MNRKSQLKGSVPDFNGMISVVSREISPRDPDLLDCASDFVKKTGLDPKETQGIDGSGEAFLVRPQDIPQLVRSDLSVQVEELKQVRSDSELIFLWLQTKAFRTTQAYRFEIKRFMEFANGSPLRDLTIPLLGAYGENLQSLNLAPSSKALALAAVKSLLSFGFHVGYLPSNLGVILKLPKSSDNRLRKVLSEPQVIELVLSIKDPRNRLMMRLLYSGGLRVSELCSLRWKDAISLGEKGFLFVQGKGSKQREVPINKGTWQEILHWKEAQTLHLKQRYENNPIFPSQKGRGHLNRVQVLRILKAAAEEIGFPEILSPHWMRHSYATHAIKNGASLRTVQLNMGHSSIRTTQGYISPGDEESASDFVAL